MLEQSVSPEDERLVEAGGGINSRRPCGHTAIPIDYYPCNLLMLKQGSGIGTVLENCLDLRQASLVLMSPKPVADHCPVMPPCCEERAQIRSGKYYVSSRLGGNPLDCANIARRYILRWYEVD